MTLGVRAIAALLFVWATAAQAAPEPDLWAKWTAFDPDSRESVDHSFWTSFIETYSVVDEDGVRRIAYGEVSESDRSLLDHYVARLEGLRVGTLNRPEQLAYWINLYNAQTVRAVLQRYDAEDGGGIDLIPASDLPRSQTDLMVEGEVLSLDDIEHRILRPIWRDPRIHYGLNRAAVGGPNLPVVAATAETADKLLTNSAREFVNHPRGVQFVGERLIVSSLYSWFKADFGGSDKNVLAHLRRYADGTLKKRLDDVVEIDGYGFDWTLNAAE